MWEDKLAGLLRLRDEIEKKELPYLSAVDELLERASHVENSGGPAGSGATVGEAEADGLRSTNQTLKEQANSLGIENSQLKVKIAQMEQNELRSAKSIATLKQRVDNVRQEVQEKNKSIELINDEILSFQIQNNVLQKNVEQLTRENEALIARWMEKVRLDAETMNEANELIENSKRNS